MLMKRALKSPPPCGEVARRSTSRSRAGGGLRSPHLHCHGLRMRATQLTLARSRRLHHLVTVEPASAIQPLRVHSKNAAYAHLGGPHSRAMTKKSNVVTVSRGRKAA